MQMINEITTRDELADLVGIPYRKLTYILYKKHVENMYTSFEIPKKNGGRRLINSPNEELKYIQKNLVKALYRYEQTLLDKDINIHSSVSHAFENEKSIFTNARIHRNKRFIINVDLENFFDSIHFGRVRGYFLKNNYFRLTDEVATVIAQLTCYKGSLPQGAPTSPIISNYICNIFDLRIMKLAKKYRMNYTRYADDLTFSTNDKHCIEYQDEFLLKLKKEIDRAGFSINQTKTRISYKNSRQEVTGVVVNQKISIKREYYKITRAMADRLYKTGEFFIDGEKGSIHQLEGRFDFINQAEWFDNKYFKKKRNFYSLNGREKEYKKFLFYKYFFANEKTLIITEGKTDVIYIKAALKNLYKEYPELVTRNEKGEYQYKFSFLKKSKRLDYFLNIKKDGADTLKNIYAYYSEKSEVNYPEYMTEFENSQGIRAQNAVIMLYDNELQQKTKPVAKFCKVNLSDDQIKKLKKEEYVLLNSNLYLMVTPLQKGKSISDIEDLFHSELLKTKLDGKMFTKNDKYDTKIYYGKDRFSKYVMKNYAKIDFEAFKPLLNNIKKIVYEYKKIEE